MYKRINLVNFDILSDIHIKGAFQIAINLCKLYLNYKYHENKNVICVNNKMIHLYYYFFAMVSKILLVVKTVTKDKDIRQIALRLIITIEMNVSGV